MLCVHVLKNAAMSYKRALGETYRFVHRCTFAAGKLINRPLYTTEFTAINITPQNLCTNIADHALFYIV